MPASESESPRSRQGGILKSNVADAAPAAQTGHEVVGSRRAVSASRAIVVLFVVLALAAVFVPLRMHRPLWVEAEAVVGVWWLVWAGVLSWMLYAGVVLRDDFSIRGHQTNNNSGAWWQNWGDLSLGALDFSGAEGLTGCMTALVGIALLGLLILAGWILWEVIFPLVVPLGYALMVLLLTRVIHRHASCRGQPLRAIAFGVGWASLYTLPLVLGVALVHLLA